MGIDKSTVSLALRNSPLLLADTCKRVQEFAKQVGYQRDAVMAELLARMRSQAKPKLQGSLAILSFEPLEAAWTEYGCVREWTLGAEARAQTLGYATNRFIVANYTPEKLIRIMKSRGIQGFVVAVTQSIETELDHRFDALWAPFAFACIGRRLHWPRMHHACHDVFFGMKLACEELRALGCKRIALAENELLDVVMSGLYAAGYRTACENLKIEPVPVFDFGRESRKNFARWMKKYRPDGMLTSWSGLKDWVVELSLRVPDDVVMAHVDVSDNPGWGGIKQNHAEIGAAAIDLVIGQIHRQEIGIPKHKRSTLIEGSWFSDKQWAVTRKLKSKSLSS